MTTSYDDHGFEECVPFNLPTQEGSSPVDTTVTYRETYAVGGASSGYDVQFRFTTTDAADITAILMQLPGTQTAGTGVDNGDGTWTFGEFIFKVEGAAITSLTSTGEGTTDYTGKSKGGDFDLRIETPDNAITNEVTLTIGYADGRNLDLDMFGNEVSGDGIGLLAGLRYRQVGEAGEGSGKQSGEIIIYCPEPGNVEVIKYLDKNGDGSIEGDSILTTTPFTFKIEGFLKDGITPFSKTITDGGEFDGALDGKVLFEGIEQGATYTVSEQTPEGWYQTYSSDTSGDIEGGETDTVIFANTQKGAISGYKKIDLDGKPGGETQAGEGWTINLYADANKDGVADGTAIATTTTKADGSYSFGDLKLGLYLVEETQKGGYYSISPEKLTAFLDYSGDHETNMNFVNVQKGSISGAKKIDLDGVIGGETKAGAGWTINLYNDANTDGVADGAAIATTVTGADGSYSFGDLKLGDYLVEEVQQGGYYSISPEKVKVGLDTSGEHDGDNDFVNVQKGSISGAKKIDLDGVIGGETKVPTTPWTIELYADTNGDGALTADDGGPVDTTETDASGAYSFDGLMLGTYFVKEVNQEGYYVADGASDTVEVDLDYSGEAAGGIDFHNTQYGKIDGYKKIDGDGRLYTSGDLTGAPGWTINLYADADGNGVADGAALNTTVTGADGSFSFGGLKIGNYLVEEVDQDGFTNLTDLIASANYAESGVSPASITFINTPDELAVCYEGLTPGFWKQTQNWPKVEVPLDSYLASLATDTNGDGVKSVSEILNTVTYSAAFDVNGITTSSVVKGKTVETTKSTDISLLKALNLPGNEASIDAFMRQSTASLLNSTVYEHQGNEFDFLLTSEQVVDLVQEAVGTKSTAALQELKNDFALLNELGTESDWGDAHICPPVEYLEDRFTTSVGETIFA